MTDNKECQVVATDGNPYKSFREGVKIMAAVASVLMDKMVDASDYCDRENLKDMFAEICNKLLGERP